MHSPKSIFVVAQLLAMLFMLLPALNRAADSPEQTGSCSRGLSGNVLLLANQAKKMGQTSAGLWVLDVSDFSRLPAARKNAGSLVLSLRHFRARVSGSSLHMVYRRAVRASNHRDEGLASH
jgi:hypothetical protein